MALILGDRVKETTATSGTGTISLGGATPGFQSFASGIGSGSNTTYYTILDSANPPTYWEVGLGTYVSAANTLSRDTVYSSSNGNARVNIPPSSVSFVFCDYPASTAVFEPKLVAGNNITITKNVPNNTITIASSGGGGGGSFSVINPGWDVTNSPTKNAYQAPNNPLTSAVTIALTASVGAGDITNIQVEFNGTQATGGPFTSTGTFPNYTINIPQASVPANDFTAATVNLQITGNYDGSQINLIGAQLFNTQPIVFTANLSGNFVPAAIPFNATTANLNYTYAFTGSPTAINGTIAGVAAPNNPSGSITVPIGATYPIAGTCVGDGSIGGATGVTVNLTGTVTPPTTYVPAYYTITTNSTPPTFPGTATATPGAAAGTLITYPLPAASTNWIWLCTALPITRVLYVTSFGTSQLVPDFTGSTTISGQSFNIFGVTGPSTTTPVQLQLTAS